MSEPKFYMAWSKTFQSYVNEITISFLGEKKKIFKLSIIKNKRERGKEKVKLQDIRLIFQAKVLFILVS